ncbi:MAG: Dipeptide transport system permease protein DppB, partial [uncultured Truepera sp.]
FFGERVGEFAYRSRADRDHLLVAGHRLLRDLERHRPGLPRRHGRDARRGPYLRAHQPPRRPAVRLLRPPHLVCL